MNPLFVLIFSLLLTVNTSAQKLSDFTSNLKFIGLTYHPGGGNAKEGKQYPRAWDSEGYLVQQIGLEFDLDYELHPNLELRFTTSLYKDCIDVWAGWFGLLPRLNYQWENGFRINFGIGPSIIWRENWWKSDYVVYRGDVFFGKEKSDAAVQWAFLWYGGNLEMSYDFNESHGIVYSVIPGFPQVFTSSLGWRLHW